LYIFFIYLSFIELSLLLLFAWFLGIKGLIIVSVISAILAYFITAFGKALGKSFANSSQKTSSISKDGILLSFLILLLSSYFSFGVFHLLKVLKYKELASIYFYIWGLSFVILMLFLFISFYLSKYNSELRVLDRKINKEVKERFLSKEKSDYEHELRLFLEEQFNLAMSSITEVNNFIVKSRKIVKKSSKTNLLSYNLANYTTKLIIQYISLKELGLAYQISENYIDKLFPKLGHHEKTYDVISNSIVLGIYRNDKVFCEKVLEKLLGENFDILSLTNEILLFNLACYYAVYKNKKDMLIAIKQSIKYGKTAFQFSTDEDFKAYYNDEDFLKVLRVKY